MSVNTNALSEKQLEQLNDLLNELKENQLIWLSGYIDGRLAGSKIENDKEDKKVIIAKLTILYGTETGNSQVLADKLAEKAAFKNIEAKVFSMFEYDFNNLPDEENLAIIVSTHGEGEPPDNAEEFYYHLIKRNCPTLEDVSFSVLALGDKTYKNFCKTGDEIYDAIKDLNAVSITPLTKCDVDFEIPSEIWMNNVLLNISPLGPGEDRLQTENSDKKEHSKLNPFEATVTKKIKISGDGSDKEVYHVELSIANSGLNYEPGDSLGIYTQNPEKLVDQILEKCNWSGEQRVFHDIGEISLKEAMLNHFEITVLTYDLLNKYFEKTNNSQLGKLLDDNQLLEDYLFGSDLLDLFEDFPFEWNPNKLLEILRPLPARLYSISSSQESVGDKLHATIAVVRYERKNRHRTGACSAHLIDNIEIDEKIPIYIDKNPSFKLPDNNSPIIMIGAGTGIAPYRAFLQQRTCEGQIGDSWLFYGDRSKKSDFSYREEWKNFLETETLERMDLAFSRDQEEKVYVQHKLMENQEEIFEWLENGAHFYVCGDMKNMAKDVNKTLLEIIQTQGGVDENQAEKYFKMLKREKRYQTDVY